MKILWLSDIHLKAKAESGNYVPDYSENEMIDKYFSLFEESVKKIKIDLVIISGDLAFNGDANSYILLEKKLKFILDQNIPIYTIPGNHDISYSNLDHQYYIEKKGKKKHKSEIMFHDRGKYLKEKKEILAVVFNNYSQLINRFLLPKENTISSDFYLNKRLCGYFIDKNNGKKLLLVFINSAWFSVGYSFENWLKENKDTFSKEELITLTKLNQEAGNLITGANLNDFAYFNSDDILEKLRNQEYADFTKIVIIHHPIDWLNWSEIYNYDDKGTKLFQIIQESNLVLTGHVHPPKYIKGGLIGNTVFMISPMFLAYSGMQETFFSNSGFTIIDIDNFKAKFQYYYFNYNTNRDKKNEDGFVESTEIWNMDLHKFQMKKLSFSDRKINYPILILENIEKLEDKIISYIENNFYNNDLNTELDSAELKIVDLGENLGLKANEYLLTEKGGVVKIFINIRGEGYPELENFKKLISNIHYDKIEQIYFIKFDFDFYNLEMKKGDLNEAFLGDIINNESKITIKSGKKLYDESKFKIIKTMNNYLKEFEKILFNNIEENVKDEISQKIFKKLARTKFVNKFIIADDFIRKF